MSIYHEQLSSPMTSFDSICSLMVLVTVRLLSCLSYAFTEACRFAFSSMLLAINSFTPSSTSCSLEVRIRLHNVLRCGIKAPSEVMLNSLLATLDASHRLWDRTQARDSNEESRSAIVFSVPMRVMNTSPWTLARFDGEVERVDKAVKCSTGQGTDADAPLRVSIP